MKRKFLATFFKEILSFTDFNLHFSSKMSKKKEIQLKCFSFNEIRYEIQ